MNGNAAPASREIEGALWMIASAVAFTLMTSLVKLLGPGYSPWVQTLFRQTMGLVLLTPFILRAGGLKAVAVDKPLHMAGFALVTVLVMTSAFYSFQHLPLAEANTFSFTRSLWVAVLAAVLLRERVGALGVAGVLIGFAGVILIVRPTSLHALDFPTLVAIGSAALAAAGVIMIKRFTGALPIMTVMAWSSGVGVLFSIVPAILAWKPPTPVDLCLLIAMGVFASLNQACYFRSMQLGRATVMSAFENSRLVVAVPIGMVAFSEAPPLLTFIGMGLVIAASLILTWKRHPSKDEIEDQATVE